MAPSIKSQMKPKTFYEKPLNKSKGILDDHAVRKSMNSREGSITKTPVEDIDIANKKYVDDEDAALLAEIFWKRTGTVLSPITAGDDISTAGDVTGDNLEIANWNNAYSHISETGASHSYINQDVKITASPLFANLSLIGDLGCQSVSTSANVTAIGNVTGANLSPANWDLGYAHTLNNGSAHAYINQSVTTVSNPTFNKPVFSDYTMNNAQTDYDVTARVIGGSYDTFAIQGKKANSHALVEVYKATATLTGVCGFIVYGLGTPSTANSNREGMNMYWDGTNYAILSSAVGTGTLRPITIYTSGNTNQIKLLTNGGVIMATLATSDPSIEGELWDDSGTLKISHP